MGMRRLEVYVDSYRSRPFIKDFEHEIRLSPEDETLLSSWLTVMTGHDVRLDRDLRIEDVHHHFLETPQALVHSTAVRVSITEGRSQR